MEKYKYTGNYKPQEIGYNKYDVPEVNTSIFYAQLYPVKLEKSGGISLTKEVVTKRITPVGQTAVKISGSNHVFDICRFNSDYCLLDNKQKKDDRRSMFLISSEIIKSRHLQIKTEE